jgi:microcystin degradation protein MlrC
MRIGIISLWHESSTFLPQPTTLDDFRREVVARGDALTRHYASGHHEISGFLDALKNANFESAPIFAASATPGGTITDEAYRFLLKELLAALDRAGTLDGLLLAPHGAAVCESEPDVDGHWLSEVRRRVGSRMPIVCTIDPHANLSAKMVGACQAIIPYRTNPHVDQRERGIEAARLLIRTLRGEVRPVMAAAFPRVAMNIACQHTASPPCRELVVAADAQLKRKGVLANGVVLGFPYADVQEMGSSFIAVTDNDPALAQHLADELADYLVRNRRQFVARLPTVDQAIDQAIKADSPVCLLDLGDNVGGGAPGDGTLIAHALQQRRISGSLVCLCDPAVAAEAHKAGVNAAIETALGGRTVGFQGDPLQIKGRILSLHDGQFCESEIRHGGKAHYDMGKSAVIESDGLTLLVHSIRTPPFSLNQLTSCGLDPSMFRMIVVKGVNAPLAAYGTVCRTFIRVDTPGVTVADMTQLPFAHRRRPLFPFEEIA